MRVIIVGGGNVGTYIAKELVEAKHEVAIVEIDPVRIYRAEKGGIGAGATWLNVDGCEVSEFGVHLAHSQVIGKHKYEGPEHRVQAEISSK